MLNSEKAGASFALAAQWQIDNAPKTIAEKVAFALGGTVSGNVDVRSAEDDKTEPTTARAQAQPIENILNNTNNNNTQDSPAHKAPPVSATLGPQPAQSQGIDTKAIDAIPTADATMPVAPAPLTNDKSIPADILVRSLLDLVGIDVIGSPGRTRASQEDRKTHQCKEQTCAKHRQCPGRTRKQPAQCKSISRTSATFQSKYPTDRRQATVT